MNMKKDKKNSILGWILYGLLAVAPIYSEAKFNSLSEQRPNFLIIMVDDISPNAFSCYGNTEYETPHVDALANEGVFFNMAWATSVFSIRALLTTGRYPNKTGVWHNDLRIPKETMDAGTTL